MGRVTLKHPECGQKDVSNTQFSSMSEIGKQRSQKGKKRGAGAIVYLVGFLPCMGMTRV